MEVTWIKQREDGRWQFHCGTCGDCGGNYVTKDMALLMADIHSKLPHEKKGP